MLKFLFLVLFPVMALANVEAEFGAYSNFIWRGQTFTENKPAIQGEFDAEGKHGFYVAGFTSNAEFIDPGQGPDFAVTQEVDYTIGKRWRGEKWEVQFYYSVFTFPGAGAYDTDEWNILTKFGHFSLELSLLDDYFGYNSVYRYVRVGHDWLYKEDLQGGLYVGYNMFTRPRGSYYLSQSGNDSLDGAGNPDYFDVFFTNRKTFANDWGVELAVNWTNRKEYSIDGATGEITKDDTKDLAVIMAFIVPFTL